LVTRRNPAETPGGGKPKRATNPKPQSQRRRQDENPEPVGDGVAQRRAKNPEPVGGDGWYQDEHGDWCLGAACFNVKIPRDGKPVELSFEQDCPDEIVDAVTKSARQPTHYYIKPRGD